MKKVLTVFLSIALVIAMMPAVVSAAESELYCFDTGDVTVGSNGYLKAADGELVPREPQVVVGRGFTFYFATKDGDKYKAVKWGSSGKCPITWESDKVTCRQGGDDYEYEVNISELGDSYEAAYAKSGTTYALTMKCMLPHAGCYLSETATGDAYLGNSFQCKDDVYSFYIVAEEEITGARFVKEFLDGANAKMKDVTGVAISDVAGKNNVKKVTVNKDVFTKNKQELAGDMVVNYGEGSYSAFSFFIYGPSADDMIATSLQANLGGDYYGNCCTLQAGRSKDVQFYVGEDDGNDLSFNTKIPATKEDFAVFGESGEKTADVELTPLEDGKMRITPSSSISRKTTFEIKYIGSEYEFSAGDYFELTVTASSAKAIKNSSISGLTAKPGKSGIVISFKKMKNADGYKIYRSTKKSSGYKLIASVTKNKLSDCKSLKKGTRYYYKVRGYVKTTGTATVYSRYSSVVSAKSKVTLGSK